MIETIQSPTLKLKRRKTEVILSMKLNLDPENSSTFSDSTLEAKGLNSEIKKFKKELLQSKESSKLLRGAQTQRCEDDQSNLVE